MKINRLELLKALEMVKGGLANRETIEQSTSFAFMNDRIVTYNDEISISHPVTNLNITGAVKAEELYKLLGKLKEDEIEIEITDTEIQLTSGKAKAGLTLHHEITLPLDEIKVNKWIELPDPEEFRKALSFVLFTGSNDMSRPILTCAHIDKSGFVETCDNYRLTQHQIGKLPIDIPLIPISSIRELIKYNPTHVCSGQNWIHFKTNSESIFSCRVFEGEYPDTSKQLQVEGQKIIFPKLLGEILDKTIIFSKQDFALDESVTIHLENKKIKVRAEGISGWFEEETNIRYSGDPISFTINPKFFKDIISQSFIGMLGEDRIKFEGEDWTHVIMMSTN